MKFKCKKYELDRIIQSQFGFVQCKRRELGGYEWFYYTYPSTYETKKIVVATWISGKGELKDETT